MENLPLHLGDGLTSIPLVPVPIEVFGHGAKLDDQVVGQVFRLDLAALLPPETNEVGLIATHDNPGIGATDEGATTDISVRI